MFIVDHVVIDIVYCDVDVDDVILDFDVECYVDDVVYKILDVDIKVDDHDDIEDGNIGR